MQKLLPNEILALTIYGEARGEPIEGQVAVASVIRNRFQDNLQKYRSVKDVCLEPKQFSCWNDDDPNLAKLLAMAARIDATDTYPDKYYKQAYVIANAIAANTILDNTKGCRYYMELSLFQTKRPKWALAATNIKTIGNHVFFNV